jgi:L-alanine-DL-glutamate epimerase-like enolase superfamily enzyme
MHIELGGHAQAIPAYTSGIDILMSPAELAEMQRRQQVDGYRWFKIKVGRPDIAEDVARVAAAREAIGVHDKLVLDANQAWELGEAIRRCKAFEPYDIGWMEEPLASGDIDGHATLRRKTFLPIAIGESLYTREEFRQYLLADAVDIVQADIARVGGFSPLLRIADMAAAWSKPFAPHFFAELSIHALCAVENGLVLENVRGGSLFDLGLAKAPIVINDGAAVPGRAAGHGVEFDLELNAAFEVPATDYVFSSIRSRKD